MWRSPAPRVACGMWLAAWLSAGCGRLGFDPVGGPAGDDAGVVGMVIEAPRAVSVNVDSSCAVLADGTLWCWGWDLGWIGYDPTRRIAPPTQAGSDADWATVATDAGRVCAIKTTGTLWCANYQVNQLKQLGIDADWTAVEARHSVACGLRGGGQAMCWGFALDGAIGNGMTGLVIADPTAVATSQRFQTIAASSHVCAIDTAGGLWCWGRNRDGEIGNAATANALSPVQIGSARWLAVNVSDGRTYAVQADGTLWAWGRGLGNTPQQVNPMTGWTDVRAGDFGACALRGKELWCTGDNIQGELGTGDTRARPAFTQIDPGHQFAQVSMFDRHTCAMRDGLLACTGNGARGQLADGTQRWSAVPRALRGGPWSQVSLGYLSGCGVATDGSLWCWGSNAASGIAQVADHGDASAPVALALGQGWTTVMVGSAGIDGPPVTYARKTDGSVWIWGWFDGNPVTTPTRLGLATWNNLEVGLGHACGIQTSGTMWCWGDNSFGQLGDGTNNSTSAPIQLSPQTYLAVATGADTSYGIRTDQGLYAWGYDGDGELGNNNQLSNLSLPARVVLGSTWTTVAGGARHACGIQTAGSLWCWGDNTSGQIGDGTTTRRPTPARVGTRTDWMRVAAGTAHTCAIDRAGALWCWGDNSFAQLGDGSYTTRLSPVQVGAGTTWVDVTVTSNYGLGQLDGTTCARDTAGTAWCWGDNLAGLLGGGTAWSTGYRPVLR